MTLIVIVWGNVYVELTIVLKDIQVVLTVALILLAIGYIPLSWAFLERHVMRCVLHLDVPVMLHNKALLQTVT